MKRTFECIVMATALALTACGDDQGPANTANNGGANNGGANNGGANNGGSNNGGTNNGGANNGGSDMGVSDDQGAGDDASGGCVPGEQAWNSNAKPVVEEHCADCHGQTPQFGAPFSLLDYDELIAGTPGERKVDRMAEQLLARNMPPPARPQPDHTELDTLVGWATCGEEHIDHSEGLQASRPVFSAPADPPAGLDYSDATADNFAVGPTVTDLYQCFVIDPQLGESQFIRRIEPVIDDGRVLHHALVRLDRGGDEAQGSFKCGGFPPGDDYMYAWAPGQSPLQFDDGGVRIDPGDTVVLQIHYNNGAGVDGVSDSSGIRIYHGAPDGKEYAMTEVGPMAFAIGANDTGEASQNCTVSRDTELIASFPHMHEIGSEFHQSIERADGTVDSVIDLTGWSFEAQLVYETPMTLNAGDTLTTRCVWDNPNPYPVTFGLGTEQEMCFNFMYVTPPIDDLCN